MMPWDDAWKQYSSRHSVGTTHRDAFEAGWKACGHRVIEARIEAIREGLPEGWVVGISYHSEVRRSDSRWEGYRGPPLGHGSIAVIPAEGFSCRGDSLEQVLSYLEAVHRQHGT